MEQDDDEEVEEEDGGDDPQVIFLSVPSVARLIWACSGNHELPGLDYVMHL
jgi:hypothetical protein